MPRGSRRRAWLLHKDAEAGTRAAAEAGRSAAGRGTAVSPGFGPAVLTCVICPVPSHQPCAPLLPVLRSPAFCYLQCPLSPVLAFVYFLRPGPGHGPRPALFCFNWPLPPSRALFTVTILFPAMSTFVQPLVPLSGQSWLRQVHGVLIHPPVVSG